MLEINNPFPVVGYKGPEFFCDREAETKRLIENAVNGKNTTLISIRRMGKTGLIHHVFKQLVKKRKWECIYVDIYATQSIAELTNELATGIFRAFPPNRSIGKKFMAFVKGLRPVITFDEFTGIPQVSFQYNQQTEYERSLKQLLEFLDAQNKSVLLALDEFQQISMYPDNNVEALLRTIIQRLKNVQFIFCGSRKHILIEMFNSAKRPFFGSTEHLNLTVIERKIYQSFINSHFEKQNRKISKEALDFILDWTRGHTYYTQNFCNKLFTTGAKTINMPLVIQTAHTLLKENENTFFQYRNLLTSSQWNLLIAIAKEDRVYQPNGIAFLRKYQLGNQSSVKRSLEALMDKEMVYREDEAEASFYQVYDCFLQRWLER